MCGICGVLHFDGQPVDRQALDRMTAAIRHRGPDDIGTWCDGPVGLGNTRLAVIDLSAAAHQPMSDAQGEIWIVYNGEVYNFPALREELIGRGCQFRSRSDTETIVQLYRELGADCLQRLRGMFALAIWDRRDRRLLLARDRLGKKPLYYWVDHDRLIFGSEIKSILEYPGVPRRVNRRVLPLYFTYGYVPAPDTIFEGIRALEPGQLLRVQAGRVAQETYWTPPLPSHASGDEALDEAEWAAALRAELREAVSARLISDVPLGAFLSGGIDSSAVVALMVEASSGPVKTFAVGFSDEPSFDELPYARRVAQHLGTDHHEFVVPARMVELLPQLIWHVDQPFADSSVIPTYLVARYAREHVTVALTGDGGDEVFGGYDRFRAARLAEHYARVPQPIHAGLVALAKRLPQGTGYHDLARRLMRFVHAARLPLAERYLRWVGVMSPELVCELLTVPGGADPVDHFRSYFRLSPDGDPVPALLDVNLRSYLPDDLLIKADRMSMAASLEARSPFLDHKLVEFAARVPATLKLRGRVGKYLLRRAFEQQLPVDILRRPKHGFGMPVGKWFRGHLREYLEETLFAPDALARDYLREDAVRRLVGQHVSGERDHGQLLWTLLTFEIWNRTFLLDSRAGRGPG